MSGIYRTLVRGKLVQQSGLTVGGTSGEAGGADLVFARDGKGRLTIAGSGLAGALVETAARIYPDLLDEAKSQGDPWWNKISAKWQLRRTEKLSDDDKKLRQSLWHFWPAHLDSKTTELRQGVGIRQATGAAAAEGRALFDAETLPAGHTWDLLFEVDTCRGEPEVEALALLALWEWTQGRCWLGASAARGLGWMKLDEVEVLRLPLKKDAIDAWPDNTQADTASLWKKLGALAKSIKGADEVYKLAVGSKEGQKLLTSPRFWYLTLDATLTAGKRTNGYGLDSLSVGGHAAGMLEPLNKGLLRPLGVSESTFQSAYTPDAPVVTSDRQGKSEQPFVPGSGVRGPLRHAATRWHNGRGADVPDPNTRDNRGKPHEAGNDLVSQLFGLVGHSGRLLVRDAFLKGDTYQLACLQHHAEDEFTAGVYGSSKFDRTAVLEGKFGLKLAIEAETKKDLLEHLEAIAPVLVLAELGHVPLGGGKWRGHGWLPWLFENVRCGQAGEPLSSFQGSFGVRSTLDEVAKMLAGGAT